ncbi:MAG TPA: branched-chain amino acid ABC transporter permease [Chthonomonadales bacterium]|nr:branched-chain amino acid ABC transporter permease [Chthonomonadales bacterium]
MFRWLALRSGAIAGVILGLLALTRVANGASYPYQFDILVLALIFVTLAVSLNLINGITGQFSIGHAGFYAVGAYMGAAWTVLWQPLVVKHLPLLALGTLTGDSINLVIALALGATAAAVAGFIVGLPSLRLRGDYLAIVTLGFGEMIRVILLNIDAVGGPRGMYGIPTLVSNNGMALFWVLLVAIAAIAVSRNLVQTARGLTWLAVREDEVAADAMGVNTTRVKVTAFVIGSAFAGAAGVLYAHFQTGISPDYFDMNQSILITTMVVLGGSGSITGSVLAALVLSALPELLRSYVPHIGDYRMVVFSTLLVVIMLTRPQGLFGTKEISLDLFTERRRRNRRVIT